MAYYLDFIQVWYISLTFGFAFSPFKSLPQNYSLFRNGSKFQNFRLGDGKIWKSHYHIYLVITFKKSIVFSSIWGICISCSLEWLKNDILLYATPCIDDMTHSGITKIEMILSLSHVSVVGVITYKHRQCTQTLYEKHILLGLNQIYYWIYTCTACHYYTNIIKRV